MCIIVVKPKGKPMPTYQTLCNCAYHNRDGYGLAVAGKGIFHYLDFEKFINKVYQFTDEDSVILHFRWATCGSVKLSNCHPFYSKGLYFAHNGTMPVDGTDDRTDSETAFRWLLMPAAKKFGLFSKNFENACNAIRGGSRLAFMTDGGQIKTIGNFIEYDGCLYSNAMFKGF